MKFTTLQKACLALIIANIIWGAASAVFTLALENIPPFTLAFLRFLIGAAVLLPLAWKQLNLKFQSRRDFLLLLGMTFSGITVNIIFFFFGIKLTYAMNGPVIASAAPVVTLLVAMLFLKEKFRWKRLLGMILGSLGILVIVFEPLAERGVDGSVLGNFYLILAMLGAVGGTITGRKLVQKYPSSSITFWSFVIGTASFLPLAISENLKNPQIFRLLDWRGYTGIIFGGFLSSAAGYGLFNWGLAKIQASDSVMFNYIDPIAGTILAVLLLQEPITKPFVLGTALIFVGIFIAEGRLHYHPIYLLKKAKPKTVTTVKEPLNEVRADVALRRIFKH